MKKGKAEWKYRIIKARGFSWNYSYSPEKKRHIFFIPYWDSLIIDADWFECWFPTLEGAEKAIEDDVHEWEYEVIKYM